MTNKLFFKRAFSMAEFVLALVILGVVATFMLRTVNRLIVDKEKTLFLRTFHMIEKAAAEAVTDNSYYDSDVSVTSDFGTSPLKSARVYVEANNTTYCHKNSPYASSNCDKKLDEHTAACYFIASKLNLDGSVNCTKYYGNTPAQNFKLANNVCIYGLAQTAPAHFVIDPGCDGLSFGYEAILYPGGNLTVPEEGDSQYKGQFRNGKDQQTLAVNWMRTQTDVKKRDYKEDETEI